MDRRQFLLAAALAPAGWRAGAQPPAAATLRAGQRAVAMFMPAGSSDRLQGEFAVTEVKGAEISGRFSGPLCGPNIYAFTGRFDGETIEAKSISKWGPIAVSARRVSGSRYSGTFSGRYPGRVEIEIVD